MASAEVPAGEVPAGAVPAGAIPAGEDLLAAVRAELDDIQTFITGQRARYDRTLMQHCPEDRIHLAEWIGRHRQRVDEGNTAALLIVHMWLARGPPGTHPGAADPANLAPQREILANRYEAMGDLTGNTDDFSSRLFFRNPPDLDTVIAILAAGCPDGLEIALYLMGLEAAHEHDDHLRFDERYDEGDEDRARGLYTTLREWARGGGRAVPARYAPRAGWMAREGRLNTLLLLGPAGPAGASGAPPLREYPADAPALAAIAGDAKPPDEFLWWRWDDAIPEKKNYVDRAIAWARECTRRGSPYFCLMHSSGAKGERMIEALAWAARRHMELEATRLSLWDGASG